MQELFNLINIRQMYKQEEKLSLVDKFDILIGLILDQMLTVPEKPVTDPIYKVDTTTEPDGSIVPNTFA